jgi:hypothetical protein
MALFLVPRIPDFSSFALSASQWFIDCYDAPVSMQNSKISVLESYRDFSISLRRNFTSRPSLIVQKAAMLINKSSAKATGVPAKASKNANNAEHNSCRA